MDFLKAIAGKRLKPRHEEDFVDRANYATVPFVLAMAAMLCFGKEYGPASDPLYCWTQNEWNGEWLQYAHDYCFVESTYYVPMNESLPLRQDRNNAEDRVSYYQWLPFILMFMALSFQAPHCFWLLCNAFSSKSLPQLVGQAHNAVGKENEAKVAKGIGRHLYAALSLPRGENRSFCWRAVNWISYQLSRQMLTCFYLLMKLLFIMFNLGQLLFISYFLGVHKTPKWGFEMLQAFMSYGSAWELNGLFPRVTMCDFKIRMPGERFLDYTVQCVLVANFLNEKIFLGLYYLFLAMSALSTLNLLWWIWLMACPGTDTVRQMVADGCMQMHSDPVEGEEGAEEFVDKMLASWEEEKRRGHEAAAFFGRTLGSPASPLSSPARDRLSAVSSNSSTSTTTTTTTISGPSTGQNTCSSSQSTARVGNQCCQLQLEDGVQNNGRSISSPSSSTSLEQEGVQQRPISPEQNVQQQQPAQEQSPQQKEVEKWSKKMQATWKKRDEFYQNFGNFKSSFLDLLSGDGILAMHLIRVNAGPQMANLVMAELFEAFMDAKKAKFRLRKTKCAAGQQQQNLGLQLPPV